MAIPSESNGPALQRIVAPLARKSKMSASDMPIDVSFCITTPACRDHWMFHLNKAGMAAIPTMANR